MLLECVTRGVAQLSKAAQDARAHPGNGLDRLRSFLVRYSQITMDDFGRCVIRTAEEALTTASAARFRALKREIDQAMRDLLTQGMADGSIARRDVKIAAFTLAGALNWPARWHRGDGELSAESLARQMVDMLLLGMAPRPAITS